MSYEIGREIGSALDKALSELDEISRYRNARKDVFLEAFRLSDSEHSYWEIRDRLLRERGLGRIED